jgi:hypothetical protein
MRVRSERESLENKDKHAMAPQERILNGREQAVC